jgi:TolA-binding protein
MRANLKRIRGQFIQLNKKLEELEKDLRQNRSRLNITDEFGRHVYNQRSILAENTRIQKEIDAAVDKKEELKKEGTPIVPKVQVAAKMGLKLRKDIAGYRASLKAIKPAILRKLRWDPPSVDGVFTPEGANLPRKIRPTTRPGTKPKIMTTSSEKVAARKLRMAKLYISNNRPKHALKLIEEILTDYPKTKTAVQAKELLKRMSPE